VRERERERERERNYRNGLYLCFLSLIFNFISYIISINLNRYDELNR